MKPGSTGILIMLALSSAAIAAESGDRAASPYDTNPACMDREKAATLPECAPQTEGKPRHYVKPVKPVAPPAKPPAEAPAAPVVRPAK